MKKVELLAPAGNFKCLAAAIKAGADAVYFGLKEFSMRDNAQNFSLKELDKVRKVCRENKVRMYLTLNTIMFDSELKKVEEIIKKVKNKVDAIICWDLAVINLCKKHKIKFHISTQASIANAEAARFYKKLGAERAILARELNLKQIKEISKVMPVEIFIHGSMCVAVSGRCFTSQFLHGRSANRGKCRNTCRKAYTVRDDEGNELRVGNNKIFSAKDLCTLPFIEKLKQSGAVSFKIEGRGREPEYVYSVTKIYRGALDKKLSKKDIERLTEEMKEVYNRGFSEGFYFKSPTSDDFTTTEHGESKKTKRFLGKVFHYWDKAGVAGIKLNAGKLQIGDEVIILGKETFLKERIKSMEIEGKKVKSVNKGQDVGIKVEKCRKGDEVYLVVDKC
ncbi:MAG: U32 family peptidase [archaeon]